MLSAHARRRPDAIAARCDGASLSLGELDERSNRISNALRAAGLATGDRVVFYVGNSLALVEAIAGAWKAGAVAVPVNPAFTGLELAFIVRDCSPFALVYGPEQSDAVARHVDADTGCMRLFVGEPVPAGAQSLAELAASGDAGGTFVLAPEPDDAMIGYTSGTTGQPKGAILTHANLIHAALTSNLLFGFGPGQIFMATTPLAHRTGFGRLVFCFVSGEQLIILRRFDVATAVDAIERHGVNVYGGVPTVARRLLDYIEHTGRRCESLRIMGMTGEPFPVSLKERLFRLLPRVRLYSFYGMTEAGMPAYLAAEDQLRRPESVGRPTAGVEIRLRDANGGDLDVGDVGEIWVRSGRPGTAMVMRGYFNRPEANREAFDGDWLRTGDLGRFDEDGFLHLVDRTKDMILSGGYNIYSREVEMALESHPAVGEVAVVAGPDAEFGECVVAWVVLRPAVRASAEDLIAHCRERIASYKKPRHVFFIDVLPRNVSAKIAKAELRERARTMLDAPL